MNGCVPKCVVLAMVCCREGCWMSQTNVLTELVGFQTRSYILEKPGKQALMKEFLTTMKLGKLIGLQNLATV